MSCSDCYPFSDSWRQCSLFSARGSKASLLLVALLALILLQTSGCGLMSADTELRSEQKSHDDASDPLTGAPVPYTVSIVIKDGPKELEGLMKAASELVVLEKKPVDSVLGVERRARSDAKTAVRLLHSQCYYDGTASFTLDEKVNPVAVVLTLEPGPRYTLGRASVTYEPAPKVPSTFSRRVREYGLFGIDREELPGPEFPKQLPKVELGKPITADELLKVVEAFPEKLRNTGYPLARVKDAKYSLNREARELYADIVVNPGPAATLGPIRVSGVKDVRVGYLERLVPWKVGEEPWDDDIMEDYANELRQSGLFRSVTAKADEKGMTVGEDGVAVLPVSLEVREAPFRTVGGNVHYDTSTGFGVEGSWEHRNLFYNGEKLSVTAPVATEEQGLKFSFEKPAFLSREQKLTASGSALHEYTSAYERSGLNLEAGVERRLTRTLSGGAGVFADVGVLEDTYHSQKSYAAYGPKFFLRHDSRDNPLNPTRGSVVKWTIKPFVGSYTEDFTALAQSLGASLFYAPFRKNDGVKSDDLVLAGRVEGGMLMGPKLSTLPTSMRYFTGGAGSVRGYTYQSIGPRDKEDEPKGGRSYQLVNLEARFKVTENVGLVPFLDGGMVYTDELPEIVGDMRWGTGLGLRYFTPIGPLRLDVATPLNPIEDDPPVQIYISIGQSF